MYVITDTGIEQHFDLDEMLVEDTNWLIKQAVLQKKKDFVKIAKQIDLRQEDWDRFWKQLRLQKLNCK
jgi:hypothetical protein